MFVTIFIIYFLLKTCCAASNPYGCTFNNGVFTCGFKISLPLTFTNFDPQPQRLEINDVNGIINSDSFVDFRQMNTTKFDPNYSSTLTLVCLSGGTGLTLDNTSFDGMAYVKDVKIVNCQLNSLPEGSFANLGTINYLGFEGGNIDNIHVNAFSGLSISKDFNLPYPRGEFSLVNAKLIQGGLNVGVLDPLKDASAITLSSCRIQVMDVALFSKMKYLSRIVLDNNPFTYIQNNLFSGLESLRVVSLDNIPWTCTCSSLWFLQYASDQGIDIQGDLVCRRPDSYNRKRLTSFQRNVCGTVVLPRCPPNTYSLTGVCLSWLQIFSFAITFLSFVVVVICVIFTLKNRRDIFKKPSSRGFVRSINGHRAAPKKVSPAI